MKMLILIITVLLISSCSHYTCILPMYDDTYLKTDKDMYNYCIKTYYDNYMPCFR